MRSNTGWLTFQGLRNAFGRRWLSLPGEAGATNTAIGFQPCWTQQPSSQASYMLCATHRPPLWRMLRVVALNVYAVATFVPYIGVV